MFNKKMHIAMALGALLLIAPLSSSAWFSGVSTDIFRFNPFSTMAMNSVVPVPPALLPAPPPVPDRNQMVSDTHMMVADIIAMTPMPMIEGITLPEVEMAEPLPPLAPLAPPEEGETESPSAPSTPPAEPEEVTPPIDDEGPRDEFDRNIFDTGAVTLRFDDGWLSQYEYALPLMRERGVVGTFYIASRQNAEFGFSGFMNRAQLEELHQSGNEIGAHTRTHANLQTLSESERDQEIAGSRDDLLAWELGPIESFAYPFNSYNADIMEQVRDAGFTSAVSTLDGTATASTDRYQLPHQPIDGISSAEDAMRWIDDAMERREWLILSFHQTAPQDEAFDGDEFNTAPETLEAVLNYLVENDIPVVTVTEGIASFE